MTATPLHLPDDHALHRLARAGAVAAVVGVAGLALGAAFDPAQCMRSYLVAFVFWVAIPLGCLAVLMIQHITGGVWGAAIRRPLEAAALTLPVMGLLFLPLALGAGQLYLWARPEVVAHDPILQHKAPYLSPTFFGLRGVFYFVVWTVWAQALERWSLVQDREGSAVAERRLHLWSRGGLVVLGLTMTFASIDWMMSLEPHWYSTIYGILFMGGCALSAFAFVIPVTAALRERSPLGAVVGVDVLHDLGNLMLAFTMLWGYFELSQFLIIWSGNLPEEIPWYLARTRGGWKAATVVLITVHLALPFIILLSRAAKRRPRVLAGIALWLLAARLLDAFWLVRPPFTPEAAAVHVLDAAALLAVGGIFLVVFVRRLAGRPLVPLQDPALPLAGEIA